MTGWKQLQTRAHAAWNKFAWGLGDCRRILLEHGFWPARELAATSSDGGRWSILGTRLRVRKGKRTSNSVLVLESDCFWGEVQLPYMPRQALDGAMEETLCRVSPLPPQQIVAAWRGIPNAQGGWTVEWGMCKRSLQDELLNQNGLSASAPVFLARKGHALAVRGPAWHKQRKRQRWADGVVIGLIGVVLAALCVPALMPLTLKRQAVVKAMQHVSMLEPMAGPLRQQLDELRHQAVLAEELRQNIGMALPLASVIEALAVALPDDTWLDRIEINGTEIRIMGLTTNATELVAQLGRQPMWSEVRATAPSVRDNALNKERFTFEMRWQGEGVKP